MPSIDGLISGLDTTSIIEQLVQINRIPIDKLQGQIDEKNEQQDSIQLFTTKLLDLKFKAFDLTKNSTYRANDVSSSNESIISASGTPSDSTGSFNFRVARLAASAQSVSDGMADRDTATLDAGTFTVEMGGGFVDTSTEVNRLNGGQGFERGSVSITDGVGVNKKIDLSLAVTIQDMVNVINEASGLQVTASIAGDGIVLTDTSGGSAVTVAEVDGGQTATSLGLLKAHTAGVITGDSINDISLSTPIDILNDGNGVRTLQGEDDLTFATRSGVGFSVDLGTLSSITDVIDAINNDTDNVGKVTASLDEDGKNLRLIDNTANAGFAFGVSATVSPTFGSSSGALVDLGLEGLTAEVATTGAEETVAGDGTIISGKRLIANLNSILTRTLNGGRQADGSAGGVSDGSITITDRQGSSATINLSSRVATTVSVDPAINDTSITLTDTTAAGFEIGNTFRITDGTNSEYRTITSVNRTTGVVGFADALSLNFAATSSVYASNESLGDVMNAISNNTGINVTASFNKELNGLKVVDNTVGASTSDLSIIEVAAGTTATELGIKITNIDSDEFNGFDINPKYINENTKLEDMNYGKGVFTGSFQVTDRNNKIFQVNISNAVNLDDVIFQFNSAAVAATSDARMSTNAKGNGLLVSSPTGAGAIVVQDINGGTSAADLNIAGNVTASTLDGSFEYTVTLTGTETLNDLKDTINNLDIPLRATIINDGSAINPYRLNLVSDVSGSVGRLLMDDYDNSFGFSTTTKAQDSAVLFGGTTSGSSPVLVTDNDNVMSDLVPGLTLNLKQASSSVVTVNIARNTEIIVDTIDEFVTEFNAAIEEIHLLTDYSPEAEDDEVDPNADDPRKSILRGNYAFRNIESDLFRVINSTVAEVTGSFKRLSSIGISVKSTGLGLDFEKSKLTTALNDNYDDVINLLDKGGSISNTTKISSLKGGDGLRLSSGNDINIQLRDGSELEVNLTGLHTIADVITAINFHTSNPGTLTAALRDDGTGLQLTDSTVGASDFVITNINGSSAATDLGVGQSGLTSGTDKVIKGFSLQDRGIFAVFNSALSSMVDSGGTLDNQSNTFDSLINDYKDRIKTIEKRVLSEQNRLFTQFANLENVLAGLQNQSSFLSALIPR